MTEVIVALLLVSGGAFAAIAGLGLLRLPDILIRMHASTKAGTLGVGLIVAAVAVHFDMALVTTKAVLIILFLLLTAPVAAHLIGRAAYRSGTRLWSGTVIDEARQDTISGSDRTA
ncbi:MAG: monovalent cation/H(+) antiporter subunit G [Pseudomonadota bacterium]